MSSKFSDKYIQACDHAFVLYSKNISSMQKYLEEIEPIEKFYFFDSSNKQDVIVQQSQRIKRYRVSQ